MENSSSLPSVCGFPGFPEQLGSQFLLLHPCVSLRAGCWGAEDPESPAALSALSGILTAAQSSLGTVVHAHEREQELLQLSLGPQSPPLLL